MRYAYIILAHKNPAQVQRLILQLQSSKSEVDFYIHIDKKVDMHAFKVLLKDIQNIYWLTRRDSKWGSFELVQVVLDAFSAQQKMAKSYSHTILLSGQDYPIKPIHKLESFLENHLDKSFIEYQPLPVVKLKYEGWDRFQKWHFYWRNHKITYPLYDKTYGILDKVIALIIGLFFSKKRTFNPAFTLFYGSQWWMLNQNAVEYIQQFLKENRWFVKFFKYVWISDEHFFQTILLNHSKKEFKENILNKNYRYIDWSKPGVRLPVDLTMEDFEKIQNSDCFFARKFDIQMNVDIMNVIDKEILISKP